MYQIGNVKIKNRVVLAPMAGISNSAYRTIIKEMGCGLIYAEMVSDKAITYRSKKTIDMLYMKESERPIAQQIFGSDVESFVKAAEFIYEYMKPDIIDINMGCPVPKVAVRSQAGSALLKDPDKVYEIVKNVVQSVPVPVTVKIRSGWDSNSINAVEIAKKCEQAGASAIAVHPRTRSQGYSGDA
ncbi:MAG: tRNA-dihydrouridine synthase, partial [Bacilli bacterium]|nr:tRNA-dihydrouridine synthase [Bacilli bacterium]